MEDTKTNTFPTEENVAIELDQLAEPEIRQEQKEEPDSGNEKKAVAKKKRNNGFFKFCAHSGVTLFTLAGSITANVAANGMKTSAVPMIILSIFSWAIVLSCVIFIALGAGRKNGDSHVHLAHADNLFTEFWLLCTGLGLCGLYVIYYYAVSNITDKYIAWRLILSYLFICIAAVILSISFAGIVRRLRGGVLYKNSFIANLIGFVSQIPFYKSLNGTFRICALIVAYAVLIVGMMLLETKHFAIAITIGSIATFLFAVGFMSLVAQLEKLRKGSDKIASGDLDYKVETSKEFIIVKDISVNMNRIGDGMQHAVEEQIKSERMKSELITNVSHDIKTPLTSIINYVGLLKRGGIDQKTSNEYIDVLDKKSLRLKLLIDDLVEASKASTGNVSVELNNVNCKEILNQALGEFEERFAGRGLEVITKIPDERVVACADGRHMWRVIENMLSNACKYALGNSRVYVELFQEENFVYFTVKNISGTQLNISEEELMQRFVRGDSSRKTEGSGLGLSIAKSLAEVQGGNFNIIIDGDLFKAVANFQRG